MARCRPTIGQRQNEPSRPFIGAGKERAHYTQGAIGRKENRWPDSAGGQNALQSSAASDPAATVTRPAMTSQVHDL